MSETWIINDEGLDFSNKFTVYITFVSNNTTFSRFFITNQGKPPYPNRILYDYGAVYSDGWVDQAYRTLTFEESPTGDLLTWLQDNAVKQEEPLVTDDLTGYTWTANETIYTPAGADSSYDFSYALNFTSSNHDFTALNLYGENTSGTKSISVEYGGASYKSVFDGDSVSSMSIWYDENGNETTYALTPWKAMQITGGTDATNENVIRWMQTNGTLTLTPVPSGIPYDLSQLDLAVGHHSFTFVSQADGYEDADPSSPAIGFNVFGLNIDIGNGEVVLQPASPANKIYQCESKYLTFVPDYGYAAPLHDWLQAQLPDGVTYNRWSADGGGAIYFDGADMTASNYQINVDFDCPVKLATPSPTISANTISWAAVTGASKYWVTVTDSSHQPLDPEVMFDTTATTYNLATLGLPEGNYYVAVLAQNPSTGTESSWCSPVAWTASYSEQLATPDLVITGNTATWAAVSHASGYSLKADSGTPVTVTSPYNLDNLGLDAGTHTIYLKAVGDGVNYTDSDWDSASYVVLPRLDPTLDTDYQSGTVIEWSEIDNAVGYDIMVEINGEYVKKGEWEPPATGETWVIKENVGTSIQEGSTSYQISFKSNAFDYEHILFSGFSDGSSYILYGPNQSASDDLVMEYNPGYPTYWDDQAYRTLYFPDPPTGDLRTWLQSNADLQ